MTIGTRQPVERITESEKRKASLALMQATGNCEHLESLPLRFEPEAAT
jgi:hypothetical protein